MAPPTQSWREHPLNTGLAGTCRRSAGKPLLDLPERNAGHGERHLFRQARYGGLNHQEPLSALDMQRGRTRPDTQASCCTDPGFACSPVPRRLGIEGKEQHGAHRKPMRRLLPRCSTYHGWRGGHRDAEASPGNSPGGASPATAATAGTSHPLPALPVLCLRPDSTLDAAEIALAQIGVPGGRCTPDVYTGRFAWA